MKKLHLICNAHIDPVWQWTWDEGVSAAIATFKSACDLADEFDYIFCHNESILYEQVEKLCPELFERISALVKKDKWKIMGGWYIQPDCLMPCGESFIRQIQTGRKYFKEKFGIVPEIATNFDSFGHSVGLVQILKKCGYKGYVATRPYKHQMEYPDGKFFRWVSPSGDSVFFSNFLGYGSLLGDAANKIISQAKTAEDVDAVLWGVGNHGGGPSRKDLKDIENLKIENTEIIHSSLEDLFNDNIKVSAEIGRSLVTCMPGCYSSMARVKQAHREAENLLYSTEKLLCAAMLSGYKTDTSALYEAQKKLLLAEFHDILPGSCIPEGEENGLELLSACKNVVKEYRTGAFMYLATADAPAKDGEYPLYVFNPMPYEITVPIEAEYMLKNQNWTDSHLLSEVYLGDKKVPCQEIKEQSNLNLDWRKRVALNAKLKPMSLTRFSVYSKETPGYFPFDRAAAPLNLSEFLQGTALWGKVLPEIYSDTADPWGMSECELKNGIGKDPVPFRLMTGDECKAFIVSKDDITAVHQTEDGDVFTAAEVFYTSGNTNAVIEYKKYKGHPFTDVKVTVEFTEKNKLIKLKIPAPDGVITGDGPFIVENKPLKGEISFQKWVGVKRADGKIFAVINDGVYAGAAGNGFIYLTLLRGAGYCMHPLPIDSEGTIPGERKLYPTDRYLPRIENGRYVFNLRIITGSAEEISLAAEVFNQKPYAISVFPIGGEERKTEISTDVPVVMSTVKPCEGGGYIFRFFNPKETEKTFTLNIFGSSEKITMKRYEIVSVKYKNGGFTVFRDIIPE